MPRATLKQRDDGRYCCRYKGRFFYGNTQSEAFAARDEYKRLQEQGLREKNVGLTVKQYAARWLPAYRAEAGDKQYNQYATILNRFCSMYGEQRMRDITTLDIQTFFVSLKDFSTSYISKHLMTIKGLFASAVDDGVILRSPITKNIKAPIGHAGTHRTLEPWERDLVHQLADTHRFGRAAMLMLYGGLRRGEALAFDIDRDVDFKNKRIHIREAIAFDDTNQGTAKDTKSKAGMRELPLFQPLQEALEGRHGKAVESASGNPISNQAFKSMWRSYLNEMGILHNKGRRKRWVGKTKKDKNTIAHGGKVLPWEPVVIRTHDFRHSFCTMLYDAGVDIKSAMKWMGHADESMILKIYAHLTEQKEKMAEQAVAAKVEEMINSSQKGSQLE